MRKSVSIASGITLMTAAGYAAAQAAPLPAESVPVDAPWALAGLCVLLAVAAARVMGKFRK